MDEKTVENINSTGNAENTGNADYAENLTGQTNTAGHDKVLKFERASDKGYPDINDFTMDLKGNIRKTTDGAAISNTGAGTFIILGWISAALTAFIYPLFALVGIVFGVLANKKTERSGNAVIFTNIAVAAAFYLIRFIIDIVLGRITV